MEMLKRLSTIALGILIGCAPAVGRAEGSLKIGLNVERTGNAASYGGHVIIAAQIAVDEINKAGGIDGSKVEIVIEDNRTSPEQAVIAVRNLDKEGVVAIVGPIQTSQARTAFPATNRAQVVSISPGSGAPGLSAQNRPWSFRNAAIDEIIFAEVARAFHSRYPSISTVALTYDPKDAYATNLVTKVAPPAFEAASLKIVNRDSPMEIPVDATDHSVFVTKLRGLNVDTAVVGLVIEQGKTFLREMNRQQVKMPLLGGLGFVTESIAQVAGSIDFYSGQPFDPNSSDPAVTAFVREFKERSAKELPGQYTTPLYIEAGAYESVIMIADALRAAKVRPGNDVKKAREAVRTHLTGLKDHRGLGNTLSFNEEGDAVKPTLVFHTNNGNWERL
jgi:branched-chain amino acid transport system substrate-binding protein